MKSSFLFFLIFISLSAFAQDFQKECDLSLKIAENRLDWVKDNLTKLEYTTFETTKNYIKIELGKREQGLYFWAQTKDCKAVSQAFLILNKIKQTNTVMDGVVFVFADTDEDFKKSWQGKFLLRDYTLPLKGSSATAFHQITKLDKNPVEVLELGALVDEVKKIAPDLKKVVGEKEIKDFKNTAVLLKENSKHWTLGKALKFKEEWALKPQVKDLNDQVQDYENHILMYDKLRRGLWDDAQKDLVKIKSISPKLKEELAKGFDNLEVVLKQTKTEILSMEKDIVTKFKNKKDFIESEAKESHQ